MLVVQIRFDLQPAKALVAILENEDRPHRDFMKGAIMSQAISDGPRFVETANAFGDIAGEICRNVTHMIATFFMRNAYMEIEVV